MIVNSIQRSTMHFFSKIFKSCFLPEPPSLISLVFIVSVCFFGIGCSERQDRTIEYDFSVRVQDALGLQKSSPVVWRGVEVGTVDSVDVNNGLVTIRIRLNTDYRGKMREGLRARPVRGLIGSRDAVLELYGGDDSSRPMLRTGSEIAEATFADKISSRSVKKIGLIILVVAFFLALLSIVKKITYTLLAIALLVFSVWLMFHQWEKYNTDIKNATMEMEWNDAARSLLTEDVAKNAWLDVSSEFSEILQSIGDHGAQRFGEMRGVLGQLLLEQENDLREIGKIKAADEIRALADDMLNQEGARHSK